MDELSRKTVNDFKNAEKNKIILVLESIRSMHNVGSVFRTADAFLIEAVFLCGYTPLPPHRDIHKTALGATETVDWMYFQSAADAIKELKSKNYKIFAVEQTEGSISLDKLKVDREERIALVFGNEVDGVSNEVLALCDACIEIPQQGMKHSLNISVATGIVLWQMVYGR